MQAHTDRDWRKFILTLDETDQAKTQFIYKIQSCMDQFNDLYKKNSKILEVFFRVNLRKIN